MRIFIDTSAWITLMNTNAPLHSEVADAFERSLVEGDKLFTHNIAVGLAMSDVRMRLGVGTANKFSEIIDTAYTGTHLSILWIGRRTQKEAIWLMRKHNTLSLDLYDFACPIMMRRRRIRTVLTTKSDFKSMQLNILPDTIRKS